MPRFGFIILLSFILPFQQGISQGIRTGTKEGQDWDRTKKILDCAPRLVDRRELVEDHFDHSYVTDNPRDIEVGYFSVEPITYQEEGRRFCEALLPVSGVSHTYFRGSYMATYTLPGEGVYRVCLTSNALIFNNDLRIINAQNAIAGIEASHRLEIEVDTVLNPTAPGEPAFRTNQAYRWELEIDPSGTWYGELFPGNAELSDTRVPAGYSRIDMDREIRGPGVVSIRESVVFRVNSVSAYKYDPIFQAVCLFSLEPLSISAKLLPCKE